jgi:hypothetical protein
MTVLRYHAEDSLISHFATDGALASAFSLGLQWTLKSGDGGKMQE